MRLTLFACAESAAIDQGTNRLSVFHFLEEILSPVFPAAYSQLVAVIIATREETEPSTFNLGLRITQGGQGQPLADGPILLDFQSRPRARVLTFMNGLVVPGQLVTEGKSP